MQNLQSLDFSSIVRGTRQIHYEQAMLSQPAILPLLRGEVANAPRMQAQAPSNAEAELLATILQQQGGMRQNLFQSPLINQVLGLNALSSKHEDQPMTATTLGSLNCQQHLLDNTLALQQIVRQQEQQMLARDHRWPTGAFHLGPQPVPSPSGGPLSVMTSLQPAGTSSTSDFFEEDEGDTSIQTFPFKVYRMIAYAEREGMSDIISFLEDGTTFKIHKPEKFTSVIMPLFFSTSRLASFHRQLNLYNFKRVSEGRHRGGFRNKHFIKGRPEMCNYILRKNPKIKVVDAERASI